MRVDHVLDKFAAVSAADSISSIGQSGKIGQAKMAWVLAKAGLIFVICHLAFLAIVTMLFSAA